MEMEGLKLKPGEFLLRSPSDALVQCNLLKLFLGFVQKLILLTA